jgi:cytoskeletal protein CcmA (bactofilin family)
MAIFAKDETAPESKNGAAQGDGAMSIIAAGMTVTGDIDSAGVVKIEGRVEGAVRSARQVLVGRQGEVKGDIETREAVIGGRVEGTITASERTEIQGTASINGDIQTKSILVQEGGRINGRVVMMDGAVRSSDAKLPAPKPQPVTVAR